MNTIRQDKFQVGDKVEFVSEDPYTGSGLVEKHRAKHGKGPYEIDEITEVTGSPHGIGHSQLVIVNGVTFSGYWFKPIERAPPTTDVRQVDK